MCKMIVEVHFCKCTNIICPQGPGNEFHPHHPSSVSPNRITYEYCDSFKETEDYRNSPLAFLGDAVPRTCPDVVKNNGEIERKWCHNTSTWDCNDYCGDCVNSGCKERQSYQLDDPYFKERPGDLGIPPATVATRRKAYEKDMEERGMKPAKAPVSGHGIWCS